MKRLIEVDGQQVEATELLEECTAHAKHFTLPDGRRVAVLQQGQHFWNRDLAAWDDCDNAVIADARPEAPGFSHAVNRAPLRARFGPRGRHRLGFGVGQYVTLSAAGVAQVVQPVATGNRVTYANLWTAADLIYEHGLERLKESIVLKSAQAPTSFTFRVAEIGGVTLRPAADGGIEVLDAQGAPLGRMLAPWCQDAKGVRGSATLTYDGTTLTITPDAAWLGDPARVWPVVVDPTTVTIQPSSADAYVRKDTPTTNYGTASIIKVGDGSTGTGFSLRGLLKWDISSLPPTTVVQSAQVDLYSTGSTNADPGNIGAHSVLSDWTETGVTWAAQPSFNATATTIVNVTGSGWKTWAGLASLVQSWFTSGNYGVIFKRVNEAGGFAYTSFYSREEATNTTLRPKLTITYNAAPTVTITTLNGTQANPTIVNDDVTPPLSGVYTDPEGLAASSKQHQILDEAGNIVWDSGEVADSTASGGTVTVNIPSAAGLKYGAKYRWRWRAKDSDATFPQWSAWSSEGWFQCILMPPTGLTATADAANAEIDLAWAAHSGENLAGYNVYRKPAGAPDSQYARINVSTVGTNSYTDKAVGRGVAYDYAVTAVATDTYESVKSTAATNVSVTWTAGDWWLEALKLPGVEAWEAEDGFKISEQEVLGKSVPIHQKVGPDGGRTGARITLALDEVSETEYQNLLAELAKSDPLALRDPLGRVWRVKVSRPGPRRVQIVPATTAKYRVVVPLREVIR